MKKSLVLLAMCTWGYASAQNSSTTNSSMNGTDANTFVRRAAMMNMMEIRAGELARQKGASSAVKAYGERLVADHQKSLNELQAIAARKNITLPSMDRTAMNNSSSTWNNAGASSSINNAGMGTGTTARFDDATYRSNMAARYGKPEKYRNTAGTATYWTPGFRGTVGLSTRSGNRSAISSRSNDVYTASEYQSGVSNAGTSGTMSTSASNSSSWSSNNPAAHDANAGISTSASANLSSNGNVSSSSSMGVNGTTSSSIGTTGNIGTTGTMGATGNVSAGAQAGTNSQIDANRNTSMNNSEPGVASDGTLGVSGTTGTLTTNAAFNGATMGTDNVNSGNNSSTVNTNSSAMGTTSSSTMSSGVNSTSSANMNAVPDLAAEQQQHESHLNMLNQKSGAEFDRAFADMMRSGHSKAIQMYEQAAQSSDSEISAYASRTLPVLRAHQTEAQNLNITQ